LDKEQNLQILVAGYSATVLSLQYTLYMQENILLGQNLLGFEWRSWTGLC